NLPVFRPRSACRRGRPLVCVLLVALALRLAAPLVALAVTPRGPLTREPDSYGYIDLAQKLVESRAFGDRGKPELARTPGYPLFLSIGVLAGQVDAVTIALQIGLGCLTAWLVFQTAKVLFDRTDAAFAAGLLYACEPLSVLYASKLLTETLFTTLLAAFGLFLVRYLRSLSWRELAASALALAAAGYVRPIGYFLPAVAAAALAVLAWRHADQRLKRLGQAIGFGLLSMALLGAWQVRNYAVADYRRFAAIADINLYYYQAAAVLARQQGQPLDVVQQQLGYRSEAVYYRRHPEQRGWNDARRYDFLRSEALRIARDDPWGFVRIHLEGVRGTVFDVGTSAYVDFFGLRKPAAEAGRVRPDGLVDRLGKAVRTRPWEVAIHAVLRIVLMAYLVLSLTGLFTARAWKSGPLVLLCLIALCLLALSGGPAGYHRFRLPLVPILALFSGQALVSLLKRPPR
ncbi:MAG: glycosyltransferase family 39 protein, partial [Pirellulales bacterium]